MHQNLLMESSNRLAYLDWLRILAILGVLFFHSAMPYVAEWEWHIKNKEQSNLLMEFNFFLSRFRMPLLFFISGAVAHIMVQKRTASSFIGLRFRRLFIPLVAGMLLVVPLQVYMERLNNGFQGSFLDFYPTIFTTGAYPEGNLSWHHLWFIAYLFVYDVLLAPLFRYLVLRRGVPSVLDRLAGGQRIYLMMIPSVLLFAGLVLHFPETHDLINDWCWIFYWLFFLLAGFICMQVPALLASLERNRRTSLTWAMASFLVINYCRWNQVEPFDLFIDYQNRWQTYAFLGLFAITAWFWVFAAIGYGRKYLNKKFSVMNYVNQAVYPFYILHQTVIVVLSFYIVRTSDTVGMKYFFTVLGTLFLSMAIYHVLIRPFPVIRFLFGAKKDKSEAVKTEPAMKKENPQLEQLQGAISSALFSGKTF